jgi:hypothetical protein
MKRVIWVLVLVSTVLVSVRVALAAGKSARPLKGEVVGSFAFHACDAEAPAAALCLRDEIAGHLTHLGKTTGTFEVVFDVASFGADGCGPIRKKGSFVAANGDRLDVEADGTFCFSTSVAIYEVQITGGSGRFEDATGRGAWLVPAPATFDGVKGTGDESLMSVLIN